MTGPDHRDRLFNVLLRFSRMPACQLKHGAHIKKMSARNAGHEAHVRLEFGERRERCGYGRTNFLSLQFAHPHPGVLAVQALMAGECARIAQNSRYAVWVAARM